MARTGRFEVIKGFGARPPVRLNPDGSLTMPAALPVRPGDVIEVARGYVDGFGSDAWPEQEVRLADGTIGRIGFGVTVESGHLRPIDSEED